MNPDHVKQVDLSVTAVEGNISTTSVSKFYSEGKYTDKGVWVTLPVRREIEVCISGQLDAIRGLHPGIIEDVKDEMKEYFDITR
jgi:hypothetical protein